LTALPSDEWKIHRAPRNIEAVSDSALPHSCRSEELRPDDSVAAPVRQAHTTVDN